jgi:hypothetical protein
MRNPFLASFFAPPSRTWLLTTLACVGALTALHSWSDMRPTEVSVLSRDILRSRRAVRTAAASSAQSVGMVVRAVSRFIGVSK